MHDVATRILKSKNSMPRSIVFQPVVSILYAIDCDKFHFRKAFSPMPTESIACSSQFDIPSTLPEYSSAWYHLHVEVLDFT
jgi:hypothetical protein